MSNVQKKMGLLSGVPRGKAGFFGSLYLSPQGLINGFLGVALLFHLNDQGITAKGLGLYLGVMTFPWLLKIVLAPLVGPAIDRVGSHFRWILISTAAVVLMVLALPLVEMVLTEAVFVVAFFIRLAVVFQDTAVDGWACNVLANEEIAPARGVMRAAAILGKLMGGAWMLYLLSRTSWTMVCLTTAALVAVFGIVVPLVLRRRAGIAASSVVMEVRQEKGKGWRDAFRAMVGVVPLLALILAILLLIGKGSTDPVFPKWAVDVLGYSKDRIANLLQISNLLGILAAVLTGMVFAKGSRYKWGFFLAAVLIAGMYSAWGIHSFWSDKWIMFALIAVTGLGDGMYWASIETLYTHLTNSVTVKRRATVFAIFMSAANGSQMLAKSLGGFLLVWVGSNNSVFFYVCGAIQFAVLAPFGLLMFAQMWKELCAIERALKD